MTTSHEVVGGLAVDRYGDPDGPTVVIVHGTMDRAASFKRAAKRLPQLDVVVYDRRGYARSRGAEPTSDLDRQVDDLIGLVEWTGADDACLVGHSLGGLLAMHAAIRRPDLISCLGVWEAPLPWLEWYANAVGRKAGDVGAIEDPRAAAEFFLRSMIGDRVWEKMPSAMREERRSEGVAMVADFAMVRSPGAFVDFAEVTQPVVVGGGSESSERFRQAIRHLFEHLPDAVLVEVAESRHGVHLSHPAEFASFVAAAQSRSPHLSA